METALAAPNARREIKHEFGPGLRWVCRHYFDAVKVGPEVEAGLQAAARQGHVVHVMRSTGRIRFVFLAYLLAKLGLPPLRACVGLARLFFKPWRRLIGGEAGAAVVQALERNGSALVFLKRAVLGSRRGAALPDPFPALVAQARKSEKPILLLPELLVWERRPGHVRPSLTDTLFGSPDAPSGLAQLMAFLRNYRRAYVRLGEPINLTQFVKDNASEPDAVLARKVRGALSQHLERQNRAVVGPRLKDPARVREEILRDRAFHKTLEQTAEEAKRPLASVESEANKDIREIESRPNPTFIAFIRPFMAWIFNRIYDGVEIDDAGLQRAMSAGLKGPLVFCPSHKSHIDYLLIAWAFAERGMAPPLAAAGANLSFFPLGPLFRMGGAFFLRRTFKGDKVYTAAFRAYVKKLLKEGYSQEFYIEGGRSRTGKLLGPKTGLLSFEVDAFLEGARDDVFFVPVSIDYEKIVESASYKHELSGGEKHKEDVRGLLSTPKVLAANYGRIYLGFEEPISLKTFLDQRKSQWGDDWDKRKTVAALAHRIVWGISRASTVTPSALLATVLLSHRQRGVSAHAVSERVHFLRELVKESGARLSDVLDADAPSDPTVLGPVNESMQLFEDDGMVSHQQASGETIYRVVDERRLELVFYKNNLMHLVAPRGIVAMALRSFKNEPAPMAELRERARFLSRLFKLEFVFRVGQSFEAIFDENLAWLLERGLVLKKDEAVSAAPEAHAAEILGLLSEALRDFAESYLLAAKTLHLLKGGPRDKKGLVREMLERGRAGFLEGQLQCAEAVSRPNLENALELFSELQLVTAEKGGLALTAEGQKAIAERSLERDIERFL
ncbi:MAG: 1-acyl-sn-glycerol-3-phosphate acyltransferase [Deltaproteobacteria bacterium]|nr:1-acyl-sn-glycerol-3-phosphate acyltransferase [Deltaproteobacteria bacterium]